MAEVDSQETSDERRQHQQEQQQQQQQQQQQEQQQQQDPQPSKQPSTATEAHKQALSTTEQFINDSKSKVSEIEKELSEKVNYINIQTILLTELKFQNMCVPHFLINCAFFPGKLDNMAKYGARNGF